MDNFFLFGDDAEAGYRNVRDLKKNNDIKKFIEALWVDYIHLADRHFQVDAKAHFHERFWEMYLSVTLMKKGYELKPVKDNSPDVLIFHENKKIYIEATAPGPGDGADAVVEAEPGIAHRVPEEKIVLRIRAAIDSKLKQYFRWLESDIINRNSPYIIAINGGRIPHSMCEDLMPYIVKAVFPFGSYSVQWGIETNEITDGFFNYRDSVSKQSGSSVNTNLFDLEEYEDISAVLYSNSDCANHPENIGDEFILVHNPKARNKIPHGIFPFGQEYTADDESIHLKKWSEDK